MKRVFCGKPDITNGHLFKLFWLNKGYLLILFHGFKKRLIKEFDRGIVIRVAIRKCNSYSSNCWLIENLS